MTNRARVPMFAAGILAGILIAAYVGGSTMPSQTRTVTQWKVHDPERPLPPVVDPGPSGPPAAPPSDAVVLFDGSDLSQWEDGEGNPARWRLLPDGAVEAVKKAGAMRTKEGFGSCQLHVEWASPSEVSGTGQGRGNSGVFLMGLYEIQVLDNYQNTTYADGMAAAVYGQYPPLVNACRPPGERRRHERHPIDLWHVPQILEELVPLVVKRVEMLGSHPPRHLPKGEFSACDDREDVDSLLPGMLPLSCRRP